MSIKIKILIICASALLSIAIVSTLFMSYSINQSMHSQLLDASKAFFEQIVVTRRWASQHGGVYVKKTDEVKTNPYLLEMPVKVDIVDTEGIEYTLRNPAAITKEISDIAKKDNIFSFRITSLNVVNPENAPNNFEKKALRVFQENNNEKDSWEQKENKFRYIAPLYAEKSCLSCHQTYKEGDVRGGISVSIPTENIIKNGNQNLMILITAWIITILIIILLLYFVINQTIIKPIKKLHSFTQIIEKGHIKITNMDDFKINTKDEIGDLATSFNTMTKQIKNDFKKIQNQNEKINEYNNLLELKVIERTEELEATNEEFEAANEELEATNNELELTNNELELTNISLKNEIERRQKAEDKLEFERQQLYSILNSIDELIYVSDTKTYELLFTNDKFKKLLGEGHIGKKCYNVIQNKNEVCGFCTNKKILELNGKVYQWEHFNQYTQCHYLLSDRIIKWPDGRDVRFEIAIDITDKKNAIEKLEKTNEKLTKTMEELNIANKELEHFSSIVAHDLKNPLTVIFSSMRLIKRACSKSCQNKSIRDIIETSSKTTKRLSQMIDNLLEYSKLGKDVDIKRRVMTKDVVKIAMSNLSATIEEKQAKINIGYLPTVKGNEILLISLFQNLISNSLKYCDTKPEIIIDTLDNNENDKWIFFVRDNGIGMDKKQIDKIFMIFQRLHKNNDEKYPGSGIGLAFCKKIIETHKGKIWAESEPGEGSTFYLTLNKA